VGAFALSFIMMTSIAAPVRASALLRGFNRFTENESVVACVVVALSFIVVHYDDKHCRPSQSFGVAERF